MWKWIGIVIAVIVGILLLVMLVGWLLPAEHTATRRAEYQRPPEEVWRVITDIERFTAWRSGLESVRRLPDRDGRPAWVEKSSFGEMPLEVVEWDPPRRMIGWIADPDLPFGGTWTYELTPTEAGGTELRITERGRVNNPFFRFMARFIFGYATTIEQYLTDLGRHFGETVTPSE
jgi:uncharacterized protein YndB with AHSA1/START domain